jgi:hypothetical protein
MCLFKKLKPDNEMTNNQAINLLYHIANNISMITNNDEDAEVYLKAIEKAISALRN